MKEFKKTDWTLLQSIIFVVVLYAWISLLGALFGVFYAPTFLVLWLIICTTLYYKKILQFPFPSKEFLSYILIALSFALIIAYFTVPTIFSGRDQGSLAEAAMQLSQNHTLIQYTSESDAFFNIYGRGKALNFPGFFYTPDGGLITQFPLPYISFLGGFFGVLGVNGLVVANAILLFTFIIAITMVARYYMSHRYTLAFLTILLSSFSIGWFAKFTLSENITSMLLWSTLTLYLFLKKSQLSTTYFIFFLTTSLLLFSRIEGIWFFIIFAFLALRNKQIFSFIKKDLWWRAIFPITTLFVISCTVIVMNIPFFLTMADVITSTTAETISTTNFIDRTTYLFSVYALYGLFLPLMFTAIASIFALRYKRYRKIMLPIAIILPLVPYYLFPHISGDHPWMLRRFVFALLPATILVSVVFVSYIRSTNIIKSVAKYTLLILMFLANIPALILFITYTQNATLQEQISDLSRQFGNNDLILVDKNVAGSGWSMITNPLRSLHNKHAVYFFNPHDFTQMDTSFFDKVFLITPNENKKIYEDVLIDNMRYNTKYTLTVDQLLLTKIKTLPPFFPEKQTRTIRGIIYELIIE